MRRTFILHASGSKLPTDLLGLTSVRYGEEATAAEIRVVCQKLRQAIENEGRLARIEGLWWQFSLTERSLREPSAVSLLKIARDRDGALGLADEAGRFEVVSSRESDEGIPAGEYTVRVSRRVMLDGSPLPPDVPEADFPESQESVPFPYNSDTSPLKVVIPEGGGEIQVDIPGQGKGKPPSGTA